MKKNLSIALLIILSNTFAFAQYNLSDKQANEIKTKTPIIVLSNDSTIVKMMRGAFQKSWKMHSVVRFMYEGPADELMKKEANKYVKIVLGKEVTTVITKMDQYYGPDMVISKNKLGEIPKFYIYNGDKKPIHASGFPSNVVFSELAIMESLRRLQFNINEIITSGSFVKTFGETKSKYIDELKTRKLYIPKEIVADEKALNDIKAFYKFDIEFVPQTTIDKLILEGNKSAAYIVIVEDMVNVHVQYVCAAEDSKILAHYHTMVQSQKTFTQGEKNLYLDADGFKKLMKSLK